MTHDICNFMEIMQYYKLKAVATDMPEYIKIIKMWDN